MPIVKKPSAPGERALLLFGSPHKRGSTAKLANAFRAACSPDYIWNTWYCYDYDVRPCDDCRYCHRHNGCSKPDLQCFYELLENADLLVIATPVYNLSYSAPLKTLLDRTQRYWAARFVRDVRPPIARPKQAVLLTVAEVDTDGGKMVERQLRPTLSILNAQLCTAVHMLRDEPSEKWVECAKKAVNQLPSL